MKITRRMTQYALSFMTILAGFLACTRYVLKAPPMGATNKIMTPGTADYFASFDSTCGIFVFSYYVTGMAGDNLSGLKEDTIAGLRIWEYRFKAGEQATMYQSRPIVFTKSSDDFLGTGGTTRTSSGMLNAVFERGKVVYGGQLSSHLGPSGFGRWMVKAIPNDTAYRRFLTMHETALKKLSIDTTIIPPGEF